MQNNNLHGHRQNLNGSDHQFNSQNAGISVIPGKHIFKLGLDVDLKNSVTANRATAAELGWVMKGSADALPRPRRVFARKESSGGARLLTSRGPAREDARPTV